MNLWQTFRDAYRTARERQRDRTIARRELKNGEGLNLPMAIDEWRKRQALEQLQKDMRERRGRF